MEAASTSGDAPWAADIPDDPAKKLPDDVAPSGEAPFAERPEVYVGAAFAGGLVLAGVLRMLGR